MSNFILENLCFKNKQTENKNKVRAARALKDKGAGPCERLTYPSLWWKDRQKLRAETEIGMQRNAEHGAIP